MGDFPDADNYLIPLLLEESEGQRCLKGASAAQAAVSGPAPDGRRPAPQRKPAGGRAEIPCCRQIQRETAAGLAYIRSWLVFTPGLGPGTRLTRRCSMDSGRVGLQLLQIEAGT